MLNPQNNTEQPINNGPIPGENFTSDNRNYPWHRPPEIVDIDEGVDFIAKKMMEPKAANALLTFLELGMTIATATSTLLTNGIGAGKWTPDMALLLAGPTARMMELMAKSAGIEYRMGIEEDETITTGTFFSNAGKLDKIDVPSSTEMNKIKEEVKSTSKRSFVKPMEK